MPKEHKSKKTKVDPAPERTTPVHALAPIAADNIALGDCGVSLINGFRGIVIEIHECLSSCKMFMLRSVDLKMKEEDPSSLTMLHAHELDPESFLKDPTGVGALFHKTFAEFPRPDLTKFELGDKAKDLTSGHTGIITTRAFTLQVLEPALYLTVDDSTIKQPKHWSPWFRTELIEKDPLKLGAQKKEREKVRPDGGPEFAEPASHLD